MQRRCWPGTNWQLSAKSGPALMKSPNVRTEVPLPDAKPDVRDLL
ncbi:MAG: hypothetical protein ACO33A_01370 [Hyphomonas sp.]